MLDLASFIAGPVATTVMGDYGAEVIKIEPPGEGDPQRKLGQAHSIPQHPFNFCWHLVNRNKRAIVLDLKHAEGRGVFDRLVKTADVMVVNFPLKVRARLRMRYADVAPAQSQADLCLDDRLWRARARCRPAGLRLDRVLRPLRPARCADPRGRAARLLAAGAGRPDGRHEPVRRDLDGAAAPRAHRRRQRGLDLAACRRPVVQRDAGAGRAARRLRGAAAAAHHSRAARSPTSTGPRTAAGSSSPSCARTSCGRSSARRSSAPTCWPIRASRPPTCAAPMRPSWRRSSIRSSPPIPGPNGASACAITRSPSGCSACCATCRTTSRRSPTARSCRAPCPRCRAPSRAPIRLSFAPVTVAPGPGPAHGQHTDEVLAELGYSTAEIAACATPAGWRLG